MDGWVDDAVRIGGFVAFLVLGHLISRRQGRGRVARRNRFRRRGKDRHQVITAHDLWGTDSGGGPGDGGGDGDFGDGGGGDGGGGNGGD